MTDFFMFFIVYAESTTLFKALILNFIIINEQLMK